MPADQADGYDRDAVLAIYDGMAADYAVTFGGELREPSPETRFLDDALTGLPPGPVLDAGCGPGQVCGYLTGRGRAAIGIDLAPAMLAAAAGLVPRARLIAGDLLALPLRPASCASVVCSYSLHHLPAARLDGALAGFSAVLKPGGVLVVFTHGGDGDEWLDRDEGRVVVGRHGPGDLAARLQAAGLVPEHVATRPPRVGEYPADKVKISARRPPPTPRSAPTYHGLAP
ncbi:MAG: class I SAM-dependent methyltransferase [Streptosporangiaceae bacterium]